MVQTMKVSRYRAINRRSLLLSLPPRVLREVALNLGLAERVLATHVCYDLRAALTREPQLWTALAAQNAPCDALSALLRRAGSLPLDLGLRPCFGNFHGYLDVMQAHLATTGFLCIQIGTRPLRPPPSHMPCPLSKPLTLANWGDICSALSAPAPLLTALTLDRESSDHHYTWPSTTERPVWQLPDDLLAGTPDNLRSCHLRGLLIPNPPPRGLFRITRLDYSISSPLTTATLDALLRALPELELLGLDFTDYIQDETYVVTSVHPALRRVSISGVRWDNGASLLEYFQQHAVEEIFTDSNFPQMWLGRSPPLEMTVQCAYVTVQRRTILSDSSTVSRRIHSMYLPSLLQVELAAPGLCAELTMLTVRETVWTAFSPWPSSPRLQVLRIALAACVDTFWAPAVLLRDIENFSVFASGEEQAFDCPELQELELYAPATRPGGRYSMVSSCQCNNRITITLAEVHAYVRRCLRFRTPKLRALRLYGVESVDADPFAWLDIIRHDIADVVEMLPHAKLPLCGGVDLPLSSPGVSLTNFFDRLQDDSAGPCEYILS